MILGVEPEARRRLATQFRVSRILVLAFLVSVILYGVVAELIMRLREGPPPVANLAPVRYLVLAVVAGTFALGHWLPGRVREAALARGDAAGPAIQTALLVRCGLDEAPAVIGLFLAVLASARTECWILIALSALGHLMNFPRWEQWEEWARASRR